jgi:deoxyribodipyrimidine photo-lyase
METAVIGCLPKTESGWLDFGKREVRSVSPVPSSRVLSWTDTAPRADGDYVLYWMTAYRRTRYNFALQRAVEWAERLKRPLVIVEAIRLHYRWASDRFHQFMIDGMIDNARACRQRRVRYLPYVEAQTGHGHGMIETLARSACLLVTDDFPCFFHPRLYQRVVKSWPVAVELVDSNGILPMRSADRTFTVAHSYRRYMQKEVRQHLLDFPRAEPLAGLKQAELAPLPEACSKRWPEWTVDQLQAVQLHRLAIDHSVPAVTLRGGSQSAAVGLERFLAERLAGYAEDRNEPEEEGASGLSPYLHFGQLSPHEIVERLFHQAGWEPSSLGKPNGKMNGFWNIGSNAEAFLDQLLTWREIGFNMCCRESDYDRYESLPAWAQVTLAEHAADPRPNLYRLEQFEQAQTHDDLWNAAQRQLVREGRIHNYLRMLWGKKILHWSASPREALKIMIELNNKYALDGRDPNSYSGIFWVLGRYDRAWGPERPIFGKIRYMTSESTRSKFRVRDYLQRYALHAEDQT